MMKKNFIKNNSGVLPIRSILVLTVIICVAVLLIAYSNTLTVKCDLKDEVELKGLLRGFFQNGSYWVVKIDNQSYFFDKFNQDYMRSLIGFNVVINACLRHETAFSIEYYDLKNAFIIEE
jgi:hypothetical protein